MIKPDYFDLLSGAPIRIDGVGSFISPKLKDITNFGIGKKMYNFYISVLGWNKNDAIKYAKAFNLLGAEKLEDDIFSTYDVMSLLPTMRSLTISMLSFFMVNEYIISWDKDTLSFMVSIKNVENTDNNQATVGRIHRRNFDDLRKTILEMNYVFSKDKNMEDDSEKFSSKEAKDLWEKAQSYIKQGYKDKIHEKKSDRAYDLGNIISKLCIMSPSYNLTNIMDLTVFQLYDQFYQLSYMRNIYLSENIFSNHGGKDFKYEDWIKPSFKYNDN